MSSEAGMTVTDDDVDEMINVQLHRTCSMIKSPSELMTPEDEAPKKPDKVLYTISSKASSFLSEIKQMKVEVIMFLYMFSYTVRVVSTTTMVMDKVCLIHLGYSPDICRNLTNRTYEKTEIEKLANNYMLGHSLIHALPSVVLCIFIGAWSDKYGRKVPIMMALVGIILDGIGTTFCAAFFYSRVEYYYIPAMFTGFSGGFISILTVLYSYASDITTFANRTWKYTLMEMTFGLSVPLGQLAGGWLYKYQGYVPVFMISTAGHVLGLAWVFFFLDETTGLDNKDSWKEKFINLWSTEHVVQSFKASVKKRPNKGREQILLLILAMGISILNYASAANISYLYVFHRYQWGNTKFSTISAIFSVISTISMLMIVPIFKRLKLGDAVLGITGTVSLLLKSIGIGLAAESWLYFIANLTGLLGGLGNLAGRSRISKVASKDDLGKVFAFVSTSEFIVPIIAVAAVSQLFNLTLSVYPGIVYILLGGLLAVPLAIFIWLLRIPNIDYEAMHKGSTGEDIIKETELEKY